MTLERRVQRIEQRLVASSHRFRYLEDARSSAWRWASREQLERRIEAIKSSLAVSRGKDIASTTQRLQAELAEIEIELEHRRGIEDLEARLRDVSRDHRIQ